MGVPVVKPEEVTGVAFIFSYLFSHAKAPEYLLCL
jgi:hypothetical protein